MQGFPWAERGVGRSNPLCASDGKNGRECGNWTNGPMDQHGMVIGDKAQLEVIQVKWFR